MQTYRTNKNKVVSKVFDDVFEKYDPPTKSYEERLATIKKAKLSQASVQKELVDLKTMFLLFIFLFGKLIKEEDLVP